jgi:hypothetical protein
VKLLILIKYTVFARAFDLAQKEAPSMKHDGGPCGGSRGRETMPDCRRGFSDEFDAGFGYRSPDKPAGPDRVTAVESHLEVLRQIDRVCDLNARAGIGQIAHDTIDDR